MLSQTAEYALRTVLLIAARQEAATVSVEEIAAELGVPRNYLSKTLHQLARAGVLASARGPGGGFRLAMPASRLRLSRVIEPFDDLAGGRRCLLGRPACTDRSPCMAHERWKVVAEGVASFFRDTTVADLVDGEQKAATA